MKAIRNIATFVLLAAGVLHIIYFFIQKPLVPGSAMALTFGIIYFVIGILLFLKIKYSLLSGIIFPLAGVVLGLLTSGPAERNAFLGILGILDALIIILCSILEWNRRREAKSGKKA